MIDNLSEEVNSYISNFYDKHRTKVKEVLVPDIVDINILKDTFNLNFFVPIKATKKSF